MKMKSLPLSIAILLGSTSVAQAITVDELAAQFEAYKKTQVANNTAAVEVVSENYDVVSKTAEWFNNTTIGGYGELHYQNRSVEGGSHKEEVDFHRFVLFFGHEFTDNLRFFSELELEHSFIKDTDDGSSGGEVELEQAYLEYDFNQSASAKAGLFLMPVGIINETHEPNTFYGVERNEVEKNIIPTT